jgi:hypothetical protein
VDFNEFLKYDPETGDITWIKDSGRKKIKQGKVAGSFDKEGYVVIRFNNIQYKSHRLAWYLHYGTWPQGDIDHINGLKNDNRIINLRDVTKSQNLLNKKCHREKTVKYYYFNKKDNKYKVQKQINGKIKYFGYFKTEELARQFVQNNIHLFNIQTEGEKHV